MMLNAVRRQSFRSSVLFLRPFDIACGYARRNQPVIAGSVCVRLWRHRLGRRMELNLDTVFQRDPFLLIFTNALYELHPVFETVALLIPTAQQRMVRALFIVR